jgi:hypothetical protein
VGKINGKEQIDKTISFFLKKGYGNRQLLAELGN